MKALDTTKHKTQMLNILMDVYNEGALASSLGFKGGTAAMLFYGLPRFSVDLDFDLIPMYEPNSEELNKVILAMTEIIGKRYEIKEQSTKYNTLFWLVNYGEGLANLKIEISTRKKPFNSYSLLPLYGYTLRVLDVKDMIAHKLVAAMERTSIANRDLFDVHYFLTSKYASDINYDVILDRTGKNSREFFESFLKYLDKVNNQNILQGMGEVLTDSQKDWVKSKLLTELKGLIQRQIDFL